MGTLLEASIFTRVVNVLSEYIFSGLRGRCVKLTSGRDHVSMSLCEIISGQKGLCKLLCTQSERVHFNLFP